MDRVNMSGVLLSARVRAEIDLSENKEICYIMPAIDSELNSESTNPIQNKVVCENIKSIETKLDGLLELNKSYEQHEAELKDIRLGTDGKTYDNAGAAVREQIHSIQINMNDIRDKYPFDKNANLCIETVNSEFAKKIKSGILDIRLFGAKQNNKYHISYFNRSDDANLIAQINISDESGRIMCRYIQWSHFFPNGVEKLYLKEYNNSGISGFVIIDWRVINAGTSFSVPLQKGFSNFGISELAITCEDPVEILLPNTIDWCVGRELNIYFNNIILCDNIDNYQIECVCDVGKQQNERFVWESPTAGINTLTINVYKDNNGRIIASKTVEINTKTTSGDNTTKTVCLIGDSWTSNNYYPSYLQDLFDAESDTDNINMIGTISPWGGSIRHEGRNGWTAKDYVKKSSINGVNNAFWNPNTDSFDFSYYLSNNNFVTPDIVSILLGVNDATTVDIIDTINAFDTIITSIKAANLNVKICIGLVPPPCQSQDGFGKKNACGITYYQQKASAFNLAKALLTKYNNTDNVSFIPVMSSVDMLHNVATEEVHPNAYNTDITIKRLSDNVHCNKWGFKQVADAFYGAFKALY